MVASAALVVLACAGCGGERTHSGRRTQRAERTHAVKAPSPATVAGKFAGYIRFGSTTSVHADWRVPLVSSNSRPGKASTWIGAEAPGRETAPFIQIGTREEQLPPALSGASAEGFYAAFWSDADHHFHPVDLYDVEPGDAVAATMRLQHGRWRLEIDDLTSGRRADFTTRQEAGAQFNIAQWTQEDVTNAATGGPFPYPSLSPVSFRHVTVNHGVPSYASLSSTWMYEHHQYLGPGPLGHDRFDLRPVTISIAGARYLAIATPGDATLSRILHEAAKWGPNTPRSTIAAVTRRMALAIGSFDVALDANRWPAAVVGPIHQMTRDLEDLVRRLRALKVPSARALAAILLSSRWHSDAKLPREIRRGLHLPELPAPAA